jgi:tripartite-type tricarboxylate transporter receptor subunit TctC
MRRRHLLTTAALAAPALGLALTPGSAAAQAFPSRPIRIVVPFAPGGAVDITARLLAEKLQPILNQQFLVENRGGAGGNIGADVVAKADKDGHTILLGTATILAANKFLVRRGMPFETARDFAPVTRVSTGTVLLVVNSQRPWQSFGELIEAARRAPGRLNRQAADNRPWAATALTPGPGTSAKARSVTPKYSCWFRAHQSVVTMRTVSRCSPPSTAP